MFSFDDVFIYSIDVEKNLVFPLNIHVYPFIDLNFIHSRRTENRERKTNNGERRTQNRENEELRRTENN